MTAVWILFLALAVLGAFDTIYYHEHKARLPDLGRRARTELLLHASRDLVYAVLFSTLPFVAWCGIWAGVLALLIVLEVLLTMADFAIEPSARAPDDVAPGERITHGLMAIVYGGMVVALAPNMVDWWGKPTAFVTLTPAAPLPLSAILTLMACGVVLSGARDAHAAFRPAGGHFRGRESRRGG